VVRWATSRRRTGNSSRRTRGGRRGKEPNFVLPAHLASALRKDKELGTNLAAAASLPFSGVSYASMMSLYTPPQPAAKKTIQKKKADAQLDSAWQKELRKRQKEEAKKEAEKRKKEEKEKEKERRRMEKIAEKEAKRGTEKDRRENDNGTPADDEVTRLIAARVKARIEKKQEEIGTDTDAGLAGGTTLIGECAAKRFHFFEQIPGSADCCMECLPDIADGFGSVECLVPLARYVYTQCKGGHCAAVHARCFPKFARQLAFKNKDGGKQKYANYPTMADMNKIPYNEGSGDIGPGWFPPDATGCPMCLLDCFKGARSEPPERLIRAEMWSRGTKTDILGLEPPDPVPTRQESTELGLLDPEPNPETTPETTPEKKKKEKKKKEPKPELTAEELEALAQANEEAAREKKEREAAVKARKEAEAEERRREKAEKMAEAQRRAEAKATDEARAAAERTAAAARAVAAQLEELEDEENNEDDEAALKAQRKRDKNKEKKARKKAAAKAESQSGGGVEGGSFTGNDSPAVLLGVHVHERRLVDHHGDVHDVQQHLLAIGAHARRVRDWARGSRLWPRRTKPSAGVRPRAHRRPYFGVWIRGRVHRRRAGGRRRRDGTTRTTGKGSRPHPIARRRRRTSYATKRRRTTATK
jgi:chemotaxis protein histidine kinase CheA